VSLHRYAARRDANEGLIFEAFEKSGCAVLPISMAGGPDAIVFRRQGGIWSLYLVEIKTRLGKLTKAQRTFRLAWQGPPIHLVRDVESALKLVAGRPVPQD
jgi:hypothetical protein